MNRDTATATQNFRFSRLDRLTSPAEFQRVFRQANRSADRYFTVLWSDGENERPRLGFAIAKKKIPRAVGRNRIRRLARESFRLIRHQLGNIDIVVLVQQAARDATNKQLFASLEKHWDKLGLTGNSPRRSGTRN